MKHQKGSTLLDYLIALVVILALLLPFGVLIMEPYKCKWRWEDSGLTAKWGFVVGCRVSTDGGKTYIPEERYRQIAE